MRSFWSLKTPSEGQVEEIRSIAEWIASMEFEEFRTNVLDSLQSAALYGNAAGNVELRSGALFVSRISDKGITALPHWLVEHNLRVSLAHTEMLRLAPQDQEYYVVIA